VAGGFVYEVASVEDLSAAEKGFLDHTVQDFAIVRCDFVAMMEGGGVDGELLVRLPDHEVCVTACGDRSFLWRK
jgi:hypothetical protein